MKKRIVLIAVAVLIIAAAGIVLAVLLRDGGGEAPSPSPEPVTTPPNIVVPTTPVEPEKPVIYLYPTEQTDVTVQLSYDGVLDCTYPAYRNGWSVTAFPDGTLIDKYDGKEYSYLFWEGHGDAAYDLSSGFLVSGADTAAFLQEKLAFMGMTPKEYNEFIVYWLPQMQDAAYNRIAFQSEAYTDTARLTIVPEPDSVLRVFMAFEPLDAPVYIKEQILQPFERTGFAVVEWGGSKIG